MLQLKAGRLEAVLKANSHAEQARGREHSQLSKIIPYNTLLVFMGGYAY